MLSDAFMRVLGHFTVTNETQRLDTVQKSSLILAQNVLIPRILVISLDQNDLIIFANNSFIGNIRAAWHKKLNIKT